MVLLSFGSLLLFGIQWLCRSIRLRRYTLAMQGVLQKASIFVQHASRVLRGGGVINKLLEAESPNTRSLLVQDDFVRVTSHIPMKEIDITTWTCSANQIKQPLHVGKIFLMIEARWKPNMETSNSSATSGVSASHLHILGCGRIVAWKRGESVCAILNCTATSLMMIVDAFGQDQLILAPPLEITELLTVITAGKPENIEATTASTILCKAKKECHHMHKTSPKEKETPKQSDHEQTLSSDTHQILDPAEEANEREVHKTKKPEDPAIEFTSNSVTVSIDATRLFNGNVQTNVKDNNVKVLEKNGEVSEPMEEMNLVDKLKTKKSENSKTGDNANEKSAEFMQRNTGQHNAEGQGKGSGMSSSNQLKNNAANSKPPNVLVYCGVKDTARKFSETCDSLKSCLNCDMYAIYHLHHNSMLTAPWRESCSLLVISSCSHLQNDVMTQVLDFIFKHDGNVMSFDSSLDSLFTKKTKLEQSGGKIFNFSFEENKMITSLQAGHFYSDYIYDTEVVVPFQRDNTLLDIVANGNNQTIDKEKPNGTSGQNGDALVVKVHCGGGGTVILSQILLERDPVSFATDQASFEALKKSNSHRLAVLQHLLSLLDLNTTMGSVPPLTPCLMLARRIGVAESFLKSLDHRLNKEGILKSKPMSLKFVQAPSEVEASQELLPVIVQSDPSAKAEYFDPNSYWKSLRTSKLGQIIFYTDVITSTMTVFDGLLFSMPKEAGLIAIAGRQTSGKGRGKNAWLSPIGCGMFTLPISFSLDSELGQRVSFLQHLVSLAVVESILGLPGYESLDLHLKWPNDIYYGREIKLGGVLVTSTVMGSTIYATIGCGFNVSNSNPTTCLNDIINLYNSSHSDSPDLSPLKPGQVIAETVTMIEKIMEDFERHGHEKFCQLYYKRWLHGGTKVKVELDETAEGEIVGLDNFGFLSIKTPEGKLISVQPDGNSFDMMHNLVHIKT